MTECLRSTPNVLPAWTARLLRWRLWGAKKRLCSALSGLEIDARLAAQVLGKISTARGTTRSDAMREIDTRNVPASFVEDAMINLERKEEAIPLLVPDGVHSTMCYRM